MNELLERGPALDMLAREFAVVRRGAGRLVLVAGEAGIGKSALPIVVAFEDMHWADEATLVGHCQLRKGLRTLRMDRVITLQSTPRTFERPRGFDPAANLSDAMRSLPRAFAFEVRLTGEIERVRERCFWMLGTLDAEGDAVRLRGSSDDLEWTARQLLALPFDVAVVGPPSLATALTAVVTRLALRHGERAPARPTRTDRQRAV